MKDEIAIHLVDKYEFLGIEYVENAKPNNEPTKAVYIHKRSDAILSIISHIVFPSLLYYVYLSIYSA